MSNTAPNLAEIISRASPRPWRINPRWIAQELIPSYFAIIDANGEGVVTAEWRGLTVENAALIVAAVNALEVPA